jgi:hypothetical protein
MTRKRRGAFKTIGAPFAGATLQLDSLHAPAGEIRVLDPFTLPGSTALQPTPFTWLMTGASPFSTDCAIHPAAYC